MCSEPHDKGNSVLVPGIQECEATIKKDVVIMLHGWAQNPTVFQYQTKVLTKKLNKQGIDCLFLGAPIVLPPLETTPHIVTAGNSFERKKIGRQNARAWFLYNVNEDFNDRSFWKSGRRIEYIGMDRSLRFLQEELERLPDNVKNISLLGFSQGAVFAHMVASLASTQGSPWNRIQKCILVGGFCASPLQWSQDQLSHLAMPSLHVIGLKDTSIPPELGRHLAEKFQDAIILEHDKGHVVPQQASSCAVIINFIQRTI